MSNDLKVPLVSICPSSKLLGHFLGYVYPDDEYSFTPCDPTSGYPRRIAYGIVQPDQSRIYLAVCQEGVKDVVEPICLAGGGNKGTALMVLANFVRDAWIYREGCMFREITSGSKYIFRIWGEISLKVAPDDDRVAPDGFYVTFPDVFGERMSRCDLMRSIFNHRDYATQQLDYQLHGLAARKRERAMKG